MGRGSLGRPWHPTMSVRTRGPWHPQVPPLHRLTSTRLRRLWRCSVSRRSPSAKHPPPGPDTQTRPVAQAVRDAIEQDHAVEEAKLRKRSRRNARAEAWGIPKYKWIPSSAWGTGPSQRAGTICIHSSFECSIPKYNRINLASSHGNLVIPRDEESPKKITCMFE